MEPATFQHLVETEQAKVGVVGLGYVGLPVAKLFARKLPVVGVDTNADLVRRLRRASRPRETKVSQRNTLTFSTSYKPLDECHAILIDVPTPLTPSKEPDLSYVIAAGRSLANVIAPGALVVLESTSYPGTTRQILLPVLEEKGLLLGRDFHLAFSPERIDPGRTEPALEDIPKLVGGVDSTSGEMAETLYKSAFRRVLRLSSCESGEAAKMLENVFRAVNIALVNELCVIYDRMGISTWEVVDAASTKPYGFMRFVPGPGVGGHCIPLDPMYLAYRARQLGMEARFVELASSVNDFMAVYTVNVLETALGTAGKRLRGSRIGVLGLTYKPDVTDTREAPALRIIKECSMRGARVAVHDPYVQSVVTSDGTKYKRKSLGQLLTESDALILAVAHAGYPQTIARLLNSGHDIKVVVDSQNVLPSNLGRCILIGIGNPRQQIRREDDDSNHSSAGVSR